MYAIKSRNLEEQPKHLFRFMEREREKKPKRNTTADQIHIQSFMIKCNGETKSTA